MQTNAGCLAANSKIGRGNRKGIVLTDLFIYLCCLAKESPFGAIVAVPQLVMQSLCWERACLGKAASSWDEF
jgi:hypothetical protein